MKGKGEKEARTRGRKIGQVQTEQRVGIRQTNKNKLKHWGLNNTGNEG